MVISDYTKVNKRLSDDVIRYIMAYKKFIAHVFLLSKCLLHSGCHKIKIKQMMGSLQVIKYFTI
jgi:hypothetical protein